MGIALRDGGFGNEVLKDMIVRAIGRISSVSFTAGVCVNDGQFDAEVVEGCSKHNGKHARACRTCRKRLPRRADQKHLKMVESWMTAG